ncbi:MAG: radical SAM protein [Gemmataceae bacterium]|nr:radical SAM protein [Gemmataceae bacterium]
MPDTTKPFRGLNLNVHRDHRRTFADNRYVYAVVSRRSKGVSIGINLNPDKICNFDCVYCQVDRKTPPVVRDVDVPRLLQEVEDTLDLVCSGELFEMDRFRETPAEVRRLNDFAFSGDGEPTTCPQFLDVVRAVAEIKARRGLESVKLVLITNATRFQHPMVREALTVLDEHHGEIWAKLEAGTEAYYQAVDRTTIPFQRVLDNIADAARSRPLVIQALFLRMHGAGPSAVELDAFCDRLNEIVRSGGRINLVQVYTVARLPAESWVSALADAEVDAIVSLVRRRTGLLCEAFYGAS